MTIMLPVIVWERFKAVGLGIVLLSDVTLSNGFLRAGGKSICWSMRSFGISTNPMWRLAVNSLGGSNGTVIIAPLQLSLCSRTGSLSTDKWETNLRITLRFLHFCRIHT